MSGQNEKKLNKRCLHRYPSPEEFGIVLTHAQTRQQTGPQQTAGQAQGPGTHQQAGVQHTAGQVLRQYTGAQQAAGQAQGPGTRQQAGVQHTAGQVLRQYTGAQQTAGQTQGTGTRQPYGGPRQTAWTPPPGQARQPYGGPPQTAWTPPPAAVKRPLKNQANQAGLVALLAVIGLLVVLMAVFYNRQTSDRERTSASDTGVVRSGAGSTDTSAAAQEGTALPADAVRLGQDMWITNLDDDTGELIGSTQEVLVVPWYEAWDAEDASTYWSLSSLNISISADEEYAALLSYSYDYVQDTYYTTARERYDGMAAYMENISEAETYTVNGHSYLRFRTSGDNRAEAWFLEDKGGSGRLECRIELDLLGNTDDARLEEFLADTALQDSCVEILQYADPEEAPAASSPLSPKVISSADGRWQAVVTKDASYAEEQKERYGDRLSTYPTFCTSTYVSYMLHASAVSRDGQGISAEAGVTYLLADAGSFSVEQQSQKGSAGAEMWGYAREPQAGDIQTFSVGGYEFSARLVTYDYYTTSENDVHVPGEILHIWCQLDGQNVLWIDHEIDNTTDREELNIEEEVQRLAGDGLQIFEG